MVAGILRDVAAENSRLLRLCARPAEADRYQVLLELEQPGHSRRAAVAEFEFAFDATTRKELRWYLEDYLRRPEPPANEFAARAEARLTQLGVELFDKIFKGNDDAREIWSQVRGHMPETRVEVVDGPGTHTPLPWELMRDPGTDRVLALTARAFVHSQPDSAQPVRVPRVSGDGPIRILLVITRPAADLDVAFRSVARRLLDGLDESARDRFQLEVLRPATFESLSKRLRQARDEGAPFHVVHFDGHGVYADLQPVFEAWNRAMAEAGSKAVDTLPPALRELLTPDPQRFSPAAVYPHQPRAGAHGYLVFENPASVPNLQFVDGHELGKLLVETQVPVLMLNACRSAYREAPDRPQTEEDSAGPADRLDPHERARTFGSVAQEVMDQGVAGVVAMRFNVYVVTAVEFMAELYEALARGRSLGEAVTAGRKQLAAEPRRSVGYEPVPLQDWMVPVVYEAAELRLFPEPATARPGGPAFTIRTGIGRAASPGAGLASDGLPRPPDLGFLGRDSTLLALDRAFDDDAIVLLHGFAGSGKTATAAEFVRWYQRTYRRTDGMMAVLCTSFEHHKPMSAVLAEFGQVFEQALAQHHVHWAALDDDKRRAVALDIMRQVPILWIWDNVEPIAGFPAGTESQWTASEQRELADFLRDLRATKKARVLLTSRRDETGWLGRDLPRRVSMPPMPMDERVQVLRAMARRRCKVLGRITDWWPLLRFTQGNPLTLTVVLSQALGQALGDAPSIAAFVAQLEQGQAGFDDEQSELRERSLAASLRYGFEHAFNDTERAQLALLHLFQGFVDVDVLRFMGHPDQPWCLPAVHELTREQGVALLDRAAEIGLLESHGEGYYTIHPALPWFLRDFFDQYHDARLLAAQRAFVESMSEVGNYYHRQYNEGNRQVFRVLAAEETNLLHAWRLAQEHGWWHRVIPAMQGLYVLYRHWGRSAEWQRLVDEIVPAFVDVATEQALGGQEFLHWSMVMEYRVGLAFERRDWIVAERLQTIRLHAQREQSASALAQAPAQRTPEQRHSIRSLAVLLKQDADIQLAQARKECVHVYQEALELFEQIDDQVGAATCAFHLGNCYKDLPNVRDLEEARRWYEQSLERCDENDTLIGAKCISGLGSVAFEQFREARAQARPQDELQRLWNQAAQHFHEALALTRGDAAHDLALGHQDLGNVYGEVGQVDQASRYYREAIRYFEASGDCYHAATTRCNVAIDLVNAGRLQDALAYAGAALRGLEFFAAESVEEIAKTRALIDVIQTQLQPHKDTP